MKKITIDDTFLLIDKLLTDNCKKPIIINVDSISTFDIIKKYADKKDTIKIRYSNNSGKLESHHKLLLNSNLISANTLMDEYRLYYDKDVSVVFLVEHINQEDIPTFFDYYYCYNASALTVGDLIERIKEINDDNAIAFIRSENIIHFLTPYIECFHNKFVTISCSDDPYTTNSIFQALSKYENQLPICFKAGKVYHDFAEEITAFGKKDNGRVGYIEISGISPEEYV